MLTKACALLSILTLITWTFSPIARGDQSIILDIILNEEPKGDYVVTMTDDNDFYIRIEDLRQMGFRDPTGTVYEINDERYIALDTMRGVEFKLDEKNLMLRITAAPSLLEVRIVDFMPKRSPKVIDTNDPAAFLNYRLDYSKFNSFVSRQMNLANELGISDNHFLFLTDTVYNQTESDQTFVRLMSNLTYDNLEEKQRGVLGDFFAQSSELASGLNLGGVSFSKSYAIDPYFIKFPQVHFTGAVSLPTEMEVLLDGTSIRHERLSPGEFELENISTRTGGGTMELVLTDPFGREQRIQYPYYAAGNLLKRGLNDYSYNLGYLREDFGLKSFEYGPLAFSGFHRYGLNDYVTIGFQGEASQGIYNLGPIASARLGNLGVLDMAVAGSHNSDNHFGDALSLRYNYQGSQFNAHALLEQFSEDYERISDIRTLEKPKYEISAGIGWGTKDLGFISLDYGKNDQYIGQNQRTITATYSRTLTQRSTLLTTFRQIWEDTSSYDAMILLQYYPGRDTTLSASYEKTKDGQSETVQIQKNPPIGEGFGGRLLVQRSEIDTDQTNQVDAFGQYNLKYGIYTAEVRQEDGTSFYQLSASGGIAYVHGTVGITRPVSDAFALVKVEDLKGVRVYDNYQEVGKTDGAGELFVPNLSSYFDNQISINDQDIPIDRSLSAVEKIISPPLRGGAYVSFDAKRIQSITGKLQIVTEGKIKPVEFYEISMQSDGAELSFPTGQGGEFYIENAAPGIYKAAFNFSGKKCMFDLEIPVSKEPQIDLGAIVCDPNR
jgi:outer membrane usher protein FimD/PapC